MPRTVRLLLALLALALTVGGVLLGRFGSAHELAGLLDNLAHLKDPAPTQLGDGLAVAMQHEMIGEALLGLGLVLWVVIGAEIGRTSTAFCVAAALVTLVATASAVFLPFAGLPSMVYLRAPSNEWPYGVVSVEKQYWNAFIFRSPKNEWAVCVEPNRSPLGPEGLKNVLKERFEKKGQRPVRLYLDSSCPDDTQKVFTDAAHAVCDPLKVAVDEVGLPDKENFQALRRIRRDEQLAPYRDTLQFGILGHVAAAGALALVVWWTPRRQRGASLVTGGNLLLAFGEAIALPVALYAAMLPDETGIPDFKRLASHVKPHLWITYASSAALVLGAVNALVGHILASDEGVPERRTPLGPRPKLSAGAPDAPAAPAAPPSAPAAAPTPSAPAAPAGDATPSAGAPQSDPAPPSSPPT